MNVFSERKSAESSRPGILVLVLIVLILSCDGSFALGQEISTSPTAKALESTDWYDAETGSIQPIRVQSREDDSANRQSRWLPSAKRVPRSSSASTNPANSPTFLNGILGSEFTLMNIISWAILLLIVVVVAGWVAWLLGRSDFGSSFLVTGGDAVGSENADRRLLERIKHLPEELRRENIDYRLEAERLMKRKVYDQAIILLFAHQLLLLDQAAYVRLNRGKTNRQYVRETQSMSRVTAGWFKRVVGLFEQSYFGRHPIADGEFKRCWIENELLETALLRQKEAGQ